MSTGSSPVGAARPPVPLVAPVPIPAHGRGRPGDGAGVMTRVREFIPWHSSVHRGAGCKPRLATCAYEDTRSAALGCAARPRGADGDDVAITYPDTTGAINRLACRPRLTRDDAAAARRAWMRCCDSASRAGRGRVP